MQNGYQSPKIIQQELILIIERELPQFARSIQVSIENRAELVLHQDAFVGDYQMGEYLLLGMMIKYAGLYGVTLNIIGRNQETYKQKT